MTVPSTPAAARAGWGAVVVLAFAHLSAFTDRYLPALVAPALRTDLSLTDFEIGLLQGSAFVLVYAFGTLAFGGLADRGRRVAIVALSACLWTLAALAFAFAATFGQMFAARLALGLAQAALSPAALSLIGAYAPRGSIGRAVSIYTSGSTLGRSAALLGGGALLALLATHDPFGPGVPHWRLALALASLPNIILIVALLMLREPPAPRAARPAPWLGWLRRHAGRYALHIAAAGAATFIIQSATAWTTTVLVRRDGLSIAEAGVVFGVVVLLAAPAGHLTGGWLLDRLRGRFRHRAPHVVLAASFAATLPAAALFCLSSSKAMALAGLFALTYALGPATPAGFSGIQTMTPRRMRARASALFLCCITLIGFGLGPPVVGFLTDRAFGAERVHLSLLAAICAAASLGLALCAARISQPR